MIAKKTMMQAPVLLTCHSATTSRCAGIRQMIERECLLNLQHSKTVLVRD
jgi:hypothetical protein